MKYALPLLLGMQRDGEFLSAAGSGRSAGIGVGRFAATGHEREAGEQKESNNFVHACRFAECSGVNCASGARSVASIFGIADPDSARINSAPVNIPATSRGCRA